MVTLKMYRVIQKHQESPPMRDVNLQIISKLKEFLILAIQEKEEYCQKPTDFTRTRKLPFIRVVLLILNLLKRSLSVELVNFFEQIGKEEDLASKSAFSMARKKLKALFFKDWNKVLLKTYYQQARDYLQTWKGFILLGVDGSTAYLFNDAGGEMKKHFGLHLGKVMGRLMTCYDVLNEMIVLGNLNPIGDSENKIAYEWLNELKQKMCYILRPLMLYDAKFPGFRMIYEHLQREIDFVVRCSPEFNIQIKRFVASGKKQQIIDLFPTTQVIKELRELGYEVNIDTHLKVRLVRIELSNGEIEILITSLLDKKKYPHADFQPLYERRWGSETAYDTLKNKLQIEVLSGHCSQAVLQDFYAALMIANLQSLVEQECKPEIEEINQRRKDEYAVNQNVAIGCLKNRVIKLFLSEQPEEILDKLKFLFIKHLEPVRPNRSFPRTKKIKHLNGKYKTQKNYRRAI